MLLTKWAVFARKPTPPEWLEDQRCQDQRAHPLGDSGQQGAKIPEHQRPTYFTYLTQVLRSPEDKFSQMARIKGFLITAMLLHMDTLPRRMVLDMFLPWTLTCRTLANPLMLNPRALDKPHYWRIENGGAGGIGNARALATLYGEFATGGKKLGISNEVLSKLAAEPRLEGSGD